MRIDRAVDALYQGSTAHCTEAEQRRLERRASHRTGHERYQQLADRLLELLVQLGAGVQLVSVKVVVVVVLLVDSHCIVQRILLAQHLDDGVHCLQLLRRRLDHVLRKRMALGVARKVAVAPVDDAVVVGEQLLGQPKVVDQRPFVLEAAEVGPSRVRLFTCIAQPELAERDCTLLRQLVPRTSVAAQPVRVSQRVLGCYEDALQIAVACVLGSVVKNKFCIHA